MDRVVFALYRLAAWVIGRLPLTAVFRLGWGLGLAVWSVAWPYRQLAQRNLRFAFGKEKTPAQIRAFAVGHKNNPAARRSKKSRRLCRGRRVVRLVFLTKPGLGSFS